MNKKLLACIVYSCCAIVLNHQKAQAQAALLVLIFGDKVASEKFHLSIDGGLNYASMPGIGQQQATFTPYCRIGNVYQTQQPMGSHTGVQTFVEPKCKGRETIQQLFTNTDLR